MMKDIPPVWVLAILYWLHMAATAGWFGGMAAFLFVGSPAFDKFLQPAARQAMVIQGFRFLQTIAWTAILILAASGMFQMSASPAYGGFLAFHNRWAVAILVKHLLYGGMVVLTAIGTFGIQSGLQRATLLTELDPERGYKQKLALEKRQLALVRLEFGMGVGVLLLTAIARASA
jgi:uncharacterized membrane protein